MVGQTPERLQQEGVHHETRLHVGDPRPKSLVAVNAEGPLGGGAVGEYGIAMSHQDDRPVAAAARGKPRRHAVAESFIGEDFTGNLRRFELGA